MGTRSKKGWNVTCTVRGPLKRSEAEILHEATHPGSNRRTRRAAKAIVRRAKMSR